MKATIFIFPVLLIIASTCFFIAGINYEHQQLFNDAANPDNIPDEITYEQALKYLERARYSHQYYIDNPRESENMTHHWSCIERYNAIMDFIKRQNNYISGTRFKVYQ